MVASVAFWLPNWPQARITGLAQLFPRLLLTLAAAGKAL